MYCVHITCTSNCLCVLLFIRVVVSSVNMEFRDMDKFIAPLGGSVVIVTDSWIIQTNVHSVNVIHQRDAVLK